MNKENEIYQILKKHKLSVKKREEVLSDLLDLFVNENKFTIEEFQNYLKQQDSLGDIHYYLNEENIIKANGN